MLLELIVYAALTLTAVAGTPVYTHAWAVQLEKGLTAHHAGQIAEQLHFVYSGKILELENGDIYLFEHPRVAKRSAAPHEGYHESLRRNAKVLWAEQQTVKRRVKRDLHFNDPNWPETWYLDKGARNGFNLNVKPAWNKGFSGKGVVVSILDDGLEWLHPDLHANYDPEASTDVNNSTGGRVDRDPTPRYDWTNENRHGTRCAGEVAGIANNGVCSVGVAFNARIGGVRMLDGDVTDSVEAQSLSLNPQHIDIYSASWGPDDNGRTVDGPGALARAAFSNGISKGRGGKGSLFVWASGNGGSYGDSCACDGYTNNPYTLSVSSASESNGRPWYLEECSSTLATTYSSGPNNGPDRQVVTTDLNRGCTQHHTGTSASAPLAAGIVALALEANPRLTWRDMQYIVVMTSNPTPLFDGHWATNGVGRKVSHLYGYGLMDAGAMVDMAVNWTNVPERKTWESTKVTENIAFDGTSVSRTITVPSCQPSEPHCVLHLEHVQLVVAVDYSKRGDVKIVLRSPAGTSSTLLPPRPRDDLGGGFTDWPFTSVHFWGEQSEGVWTVELINAGRPSNTGHLKLLQLLLHGTSTDPLLRCHPECRSPCSGPGNDQCAECMHYRLGDDNGPCVGNCPASYFVDSTSHVCSKCAAADCATCESAHPTQCLACADGFFLDPLSASCGRSCPASSWPDGVRGLCVTCLDSCDVCVDGSSCSECSQGYEWLGSRASCLVKCAANQYRDESSSCYPCDSTCSRCHGPSASHCLMCSGSLYLDNTTCVSQCPYGTYDNQNMCHRCDTSCVTCDGPASNNCHSCSNGFQLTPYNECALWKPCTAFEYRHASGSCLSCHATCGTCTGPNDNDCVSCNGSTGYPYLNGGSHCVTTCSDHEYIDADVCRSCDTTCLLCTGRGPSQCTACSIGSVLQDGSCLSSCRLGFYSENGTHVCLLCSKSCLSCTGSSDDDCLQCTVGKLLEGGSCVDACSVGRFSFSEENNGDSHASLECLPCHHSCAECSGQRSDQCLHCANNMILKQNSCIAKPQCFDNQYYDDFHQECVSCHESCLACSGSSASHCTTCPPARHHTSAADGGTCDDCCNLHGQPTVVTNTTTCCLCSGSVMHATRTSSPECTPTMTLHTTVAAPSTHGLQTTSADKKDSSDIGSHDTQPHELEMSMAVVTAIIGAVVLASCAVYGIVFGLLWARARTGACGARCSDGVVYVQVDTVADGEGRRGTNTAAYLVCDTVGQSCGEEEDEVEDQEGMSTHKLQPTVRLGSRALAGDDEN